jgi:hypothetical protein
MDLTESQSVDGATSDDEEDVDDDLAMGHAPRATAAGRVSETDRPTPNELTPEWIVISHHRVVLLLL